MPPPLRIAIVGGGITGLHLLLGLLARLPPWQIQHVTLYERYSSFRSDVGAGFGLSANAERAMALILPDILEAYKTRAANPNGEDYFRWEDGYGDKGVLCKLYLGPNGFQGCRRADFLEQLVALLGGDRIRERVRLGWELVDLEEGETGEVKLRFRDGTEAVADVGECNTTTVCGERALRTPTHGSFWALVQIPDTRFARSLAPVISTAPLEHINAGVCGPRPLRDCPLAAQLDLANILAVIGCDGVRSRVRELIIPGPAAHAGYTQKFCFRALLPMADAVAAVGSAKASTRIMYNGPGAHAITYPVANGTFLNVLLVISDPKPIWTTSDGSGRHTAPGSREEAIAAFADWHQPTLRDLAALFPERPEKWAIFDMLDHPAESYLSSGGCVCLAGDAAHATGPHLGAGAGFGIEDALVLAEVLAAAAATVATGSDQRSGGKEDVIRTGVRAVRAALAVYNSVRYDRTQWLIKHTRDAVDLFQWTNERGKDAKTFTEEISWRFHTIWDYDTDGMVKEALEGFRSRLSQDDHYPPPKKDE